MPSRAPINEFLRAACKVQRATATAESLGGRVCVAASAPFSILFIGVKHTAHRMRASSFSSAVRARATGPEPSPNCRFRCFCFSFSFSFSSA